MPDPISIGALVALVLSTAAEEVVKDTVEDATKGAYKVLKEKLSRLGSAEVDALEKSPGSIGRKLVVAELVDAQSKNEQESFVALAEALAVAMKMTISAGALEIPWNAELFKREPKCFVITFSRLDQHHRLEVLPMSVFSNSRIELDGNRLKKRWGVGKQTITFKVGFLPNAFQLQFQETRRSEVSAIELWVDNRPILRSP